MRNPPKPKVLRPGRPRAFDRLTAEEIRELHRDYLNPSGKPYNASELARLYGVTVPTINAVLKREGAYG